MKRIAWLRLPPIVLGKGKGGKLDWRLTIDWFDCGWNDPAIVMAGLKGNDPEPGLVQGRPPLELVGLRPHATKRMKAFWRGWISLQGFIWKRWFVKSGPFNSSASLGQPLPQVAGLNIWIPAPVGDKFRRNDRTVDSVSPLGTPCGEVRNDNIKCVVTRRGFHVSLRDT